jgi:hypothetical protein
MFKELMHSLTGYPQGVLTTSGLNVAVQSAAMQSAAMQNSILRQEPSARRAISKKIFHGTVEVLQVANGYIVNIGRKEGYEYETYIAETITDVNERIAAAIVAFQLES